ncbi:hypothetical protein LX36DRAFT_208824 [Colletotrichum falcatum]|nr:hypothetical protein LX36DRAFT_208824 [Colletotrichum falcatum]
MCTVRTYTAGRRRAYAQHLLADLLPVRDAIRMSQGYLPTSLGRYLHPRTDTWCMYVSPTRPMNPAELGIDVGGSNDAVDPQAPWMSFSFFCFLLLLLLLLFFSLFFFFDPFAFRGV